MGSRLAVLWYTHQYQPDDGSIGPGSSGSRVTTRPVANATAIPTTGSRENGRRIRHGKTTLDRGDDDRDDGQRGE